MSQSQATAPGSQPSLQVQGQSVPLRLDGRLQNLGDWSPEVAEALAAQVGLTLSDEHWAVLRAMREFFEEFHLSPPRKLLKRALEKGGQPELASDERLDALFPGDVLIQGSKLAGVPRPHLDAELEHRTHSGREFAGSGKGVNEAGETIEVDGETLELTPSGNLVALHRWNERVAEALAAKEGIKLTDDHWEVVDYLRRFYFEYGISPMVRILMRHMAEEVGPEHASEEHLYRLFPKGPSRQGSRIAGLPEPQGCIDSP